MALLLIGLVMAFVKAPKPFSLLQKVGMLVSGIALVSALLFPIASLYGGIRKFNLLGTFQWLMEQSERETSILCEYDFFAVIVVALLVFTPLLSAALYCCNRGKALAGVLLLCAPLYLTLIFNFCSSLEGTSLAIGGIVPLVCGLVLIVLPWFVKEKDGHRQTDGRTVWCLFGVMALVTLVPAMLLQYMIHSAEEMKERRKESARMEWAEREERAEAEVAEEAAPVDETFITGDLKRFASLKVADLDNSGAVYEYQDEKEYRIQIVSDHGSMVIRAYRQGSDTPVYLDAGTFFDDICDGYDEVSSLCEYGFAQHDFDHDGEDELIVAARINSETWGNPIVVNVYRMKDMYCWSLPAPRDDDGKAILYGVPVVRVVGDLIEIREATDNINIATYSLQEGKRFVCLHTENVSNYGS